MSAHTPGPWRLMEVGDGGNVHLCPAASDCISILTVTEEDGIAFAGVFKDGDAHLIAAAPDLLEATEAYIEAQDNLDNQEFNGINADNYFVLVRRRNEARKHLDVAIAKARGDT